MTLQTHLDGAIVSKSDNMPEGQENFNYTMQILLS